MKSKPTLTTSLPNGCDFADWRKPEDGADPDLWADAWRRLGTAIMQRNVRDEDVAWLTSDDCINIFLPALGINEGKWLDMVDELFRQRYFEW